MKDRIDMRGEFYLKHCGPLARPAALVTPGAATAAMARGLMPYGEQPAAITAVTRAWNSPLATNALRTAARVEAPMLSWFTQKL